MLASLKKQEMFSLVDWDVEVSDLERSKFWNIN
jgi:hypothetical protein